MPQQECSSTEQVKTTITAAATSAEEEKQNQEHQEEDEPKRLNRELTRREKSAHAAEVWGRRKHDRSSSGSSGSGDNDKSGAAARPPRLGPKRKVAVFIGYNGSQYDGLQINPGTHTISKVLSEAMVRVGCIAPENVSPLSKVKWMNASRTDKRVHALVNIVSLNMVMVRESLDEITSLINAELPEDVRVLGIKRVVSSFHPQRMCDGRLYEYIIPTYAFKHTGPIEPTEERCMDKDSAPMDYRISSDDVKRINTLLSHYCGTLSFHNYTKRENYVPAALKRYIKSFTCSDPFMNSGIECVVLSVHGQSFMIHQIRRMIGAVVAVMRGMIDEETFIQSFDEDKNVRVPCVPGDGLLLAELFYENFNKRHAATHGPVSMEPFDESRSKMRQQLYDWIMKTEAKERIMAKWLHEDLVKYMNSSHPTYDRDNSSVDGNDDSNDKERPSKRQKKDGEEKEEGEVNQRQQE